MNTERRLLQSLSRGEKDAYEEVFLRYHAKTYRFLRAILHGDDAAEDLAQNVFLKLWNSRETLPALRSLDAFLFTVARNEACDFLRRKQTGLKYLLTEFKHEESDCELSYDYDNEKMERTVTRTIDQMPAQRQLVFRLSREQHLSNQEIAEQLNLSKRTVDRHLSLALSDIRQAIGPLVSSVTLFFFSHWV